MTTDAQLFLLLAGAIIPLLVGLITKSSASSALKSVLNLGLTALASLLNEIVPGDFNWKPFIVKWATAWVISIATYYGFYKPTRTSGKVQDITGNVGLG